MVRVYESYIKKKGLPSYDPSTYMISKNRKRKVTVSQLSRLPRGIRNNNPGNIRKSHEEWIGLSKDQTDKEFFVFAGYMWGLRALFKIILNYNKKHHLNTIEEVISRWAPSEDNNDTASYIEHVCKYTKTSPEDTIDFTDRNTLVKIAMGIVVHENGLNYHPDSYPCWYPPLNYSVALSMAMGEKVDGSVCVR